MTTKEAMAIGIRIAQDHEFRVIQMMNAVDATIEKALHGCQISLAADIMMELEKAALIPNDGKSDG